MPGRFLPGPVFGLNLVGRQTLPQQEQVTTALDTSPQLTRRSRAGGPASPAVQRSHQAIIEKTTSQNSIPLRVRRYSCLGGLAEYGAPFRNEFAQTIDPTWGRITQVNVVEDSEKMGRILARVAASGVDEAAAEQISDVPAVAWTSSQPARG